MNIYPSSRAIPVVVTALLVGCASTTPNITLDRSRSGPIDTVSLLRVTESQDFMVRNLSGLPAALGGAIGVAVSGSAEAARNAAFVKAYNLGSTRLSNSLVDNLKRDLSARGMRTSYSPEDFARIKAGQDDYGHIETDKNAILSVWFGPVGYVADGVVDAPYQPWVVVHVRLLDGQTKHVISQKTYTAGYRAKTEGAVFVPCAAGSRFSTFEALMADFRKSVEALSECERAISRQAALDLG